MPCRPSCLPDARVRGQPASGGRIEHPLQCESWTAGEAAILATAGVMTPTVGATAEETVGQAAQGGTDMRGHRVGDATAVFMEVGIARVMDARLDAPVTTTEAKQIIWGGVVSVATTHQMNEPFFGMRVGEVVPVPVDGHELRGEGEPEGFRRERTALDLTGLDAPARFLNRARLRGKKPLGVASGSRDPTAWVGCP